MKVEVGKVSYNREHLALNITSHMLYLAETHILILYGTVIS